MLFLAGWKTATKHTHTAWESRGANIISNEACVAFPALWRNLTAPARVEKVSEFFALDFPPFFASSSPSLSKL